MTKEGVNRLKGKSTVVSLSDARPLSSLLNELSIVLTANPGLRRINSSLRDKTESSVLLVHA